jgi:hypothetical protein
MGGDLRSFWCHAVVELTAAGGSSVYDPSYGTWFGSEAAWMDGSVVAYVTTSNTTVKYTAGSYGFSFTNTGQ